MPSFDIGSSQIVKLVVPEEYATEEDRIVEELCRGASGNVRTHGAALPLELPMTRSMLREFFHRQTAAEWLVARSGMTGADAALRLKQVQVDPDTALSALAGNPRWLIGFAAAMSQHPAAIVFTTTGCDAMGTRRALALANQQLQDAAGVYVTCFPELGISEPEYAAVLPVVSRELEQAA